MTVAVATAVMFSSHSLLSLVPVTVTWSGHLGRAFGPGIWAGHLGRAFGPGIWAGYLGRAFGHDDLWVKMVC
jgi:hypothetical protein